MHVESHSWIISLFLPQCCCDLISANYVEGQECFLHFVKTIIHLPLTYRLPTPTL